MHTDADDLHTQQLECETNHPPTPAIVRVNVVGTGVVPVILSSISFFFLFSLTAMTSMNTVMRPPWKQ